MDKTIVRGIILWIETMSRLIISVITIYTFSNAREINNLSNYNFGFIASIIFLLIWCLLPTYYLIKDERRIKWNKHKRKK